MRSQDTGTARRINRYRKTLQVQIKTHTPGGQDAIAVLGFSARLQMACDNNGLTKGSAIWYFQFYLMGKVHASRQSLLHSSTLAVDLEQRELLETYLEPDNFMLRTYATD